MKMKKFLCKCNSYCLNYKEEQLEKRVHHVLMKCRKTLQVHQRRPMKLRMKMTDI